MPQSAICKKLFRLMLMKLSVIVATRNRAHAIIPCLDSIAAALAQAAPIEAEIIVVDNGSTDNTGEVLRAWTNTNSVAITSLIEPRAGKGRALNRALAAARGDLLAFTDDDCRLYPDYVEDLLRHAAADAEPVVRGGRTELGDPTDLPLTINTDPVRIRWSRRQNSARHQPIAGQINGCNMTMPRVVVEKIGPFDERFGPGSVIGSGDDTEFILRAYLAYITLEHVPDMTVLHFHGRKTPAEGRRLLQRYLIANGAELAKHGWKHPNLCRPFYWDCKNAVREILAGGISTSLPYFSHRDKVAYSIRGALKYLFVAMHHSTRTL